MSSPTGQSGEAAAAIRRAVLIVNPRSGRGRAEGLVRELAERLGGAGIETARFDVHAAGAGEAIERALGEWGRTAAIVVGGDGTVHTHADVMARASAPVYHAATGTENLFAREFGMSGQAEKVLAALRAGHERRVDLAHCAMEATHSAGEAPESCGSRPFLIMAGIGFDAGVIHRLAAARRGAITHLSYVAPIVRETLGHRPPRFRVEVDGKEVVGSGRGMVVVANARQYASRLDPAPRADMADGKLDVVFFPARTALRLGLWCALSRLRLHEGRRGLVTGRGREVVVRAEDGRAVLQLDGEAVGPADGRAGVWRFGVDAGALSVLAS